MSEVKNKRVLTEIAKRVVKTICNNYKARIAFKGSGLSVEEMDYIDEKIIQIGNKITDKKTCVTMYELVEEYFDFTTIDI